MYFRSKWCPGSQLQKITLSFFTLELFLVQVVEKSKNYWYHTESVSGDFEHFLPARLPSRSGTVIVCLSACKRRMLRVLVFSLSGFLKTNVGQVADIEPLATSKLSGLITNRTHPQRHRELGRRRMRWGWPGGWEQWTRGTWWWWWEWWGGWETSASRTGKFLHTHSCRQTSCLSLSSVLQRPDPSSSSPGHRVAGEIGWCQVISGKLGSGPIKQETNLFKTKTFTAAFK